jgi:hypothetical protein
MYFAVKRSELCVCVCVRACVRVYMYVCERDDFFLVNCPTEFYVILKCTIPVNVNEIAYICCDTHNTK